MVEYATANSALARRSQVGEPVFIIGSSTW
jgi:hypothetical protein